MMLQQQTVTIQNVLELSTAFSSLKSLMNITTPVILRQRTRSATTNAERVKTAITRVGEYFAHISAKQPSVFIQIQFICLKVNVCLAFQQNPGLNGIGKGNLCYIKR